MKRLLSLLILAMTVSTTAFSLTPQMPPFLREGDRIAIIAPSGTHSQTPVDSACAVFQRWGFVPVVGKNVGQSFHGFAGTVEQRTHDMLWALRDTTVKAIMPVIGGYGASQVLCEIPIDVFAQNPKWIIGFSDITALLSAEVAAGNMAIHGNSCYWLRDHSGEDEISQTFRKILTGEELPHYTVGGHKLNHEGEAQGILLGGNISVFTDLAGSPYDFLSPEITENNDIILFFEDTNEDISHVDRMLHQLKARGLFNGAVKGVIVGRFKGYKPMKGFNTMEEMLDLYLKDMGIPVCYDFPTGHFTDRNYPLIEGAPVTLRVTKQQAELEFISND